MAISLTLPGSWSASPSLVDFGVDSAGKDGLTQFRAVRLGSRFKVRFDSLPSLKWADFQAVLAAVLSAHAQGETLLVSWPQQAFATAIGAPAVNGAGQGGGSLVVNGFTAGAQIPAGVFFSLTAGGRNYLYQVAQAATADAGGNATVYVSPWLRETAPASGAALNFAAPAIEGFLDKTQWTLDRLSWASFQTFTVSEIQ